MRSTWNRMSRRRMLGAGATTGIGLTALGLVGCGGDDDDEQNNGGNGNGGSGTVAPTGTAAPNETPTAAAGTPKRGGTFRMANRTFDVSLDPHYTNRPELIYVWQSISHPLLELDAKNEVTNRGAAESWEVIDNQTISFKLWPGITFHDKAPVNGRAFTSEDVKYSLERMAEEGATRASLFAPIASIDTPDAETVVLNLSSPSVPLLYFLGSTYNVMVAREAVEQYGDLTVGDAAVGIGPFMVTNLSLENGAQLERNPNYFREGLPYLDALDFIPLSDPAVALPNAFRAGESEMVSLRSDDLEQIQSQVGDTVSSRVGTIVPYGMLMNNAVEPWNDPRVRKAFHLVINRQQVAEALGPDSYLMAPVLQPLADYALSEDELLEIPGYRADKDEDLAEAKALLVAAGFENDFNDLSFTLQSSSQSNYSEQWEILVPQLQALGVNLEMRPMEHTAFKSAEREKDFSAEFSGFLADSEPDSPLTILHHTNGSRNYVNYSNPEIDALIDQQRVEFDRETRIELCREISRKLIDDVAYAWMVGSWSNLTYHEYLKGYETNPASIYEGNFVEVWMDKG